MTDIEYEASDDITGDGLCDVCGRSDVTIARTSKGKTICTDCDEEEDDTPYRIAAPAPKPPRATLDTPDGALIEWRMSGHPNIRVRAVGDEWDVLVDGAQNGRFVSVQGAKACARRSARLHPGQRIEWTYYEQSDGWKQDKNT